MEASRRKVILINRSFQLNIIAHFIGLATFAIGAFYAANAWFFYKLAELGHELQLPADHVFFQFVNAQKLQMNWIFLTVSLLVVAVLSVGGALLSHKVAGPVYRLCQHLKGINEGHTVKDLSFRKGDYFSEIADHINPVLKLVKQEKNDLDKAG